MFRSKLFSLLKSLNEQEFKRFGEFMNSPYYNKSIILKKLHSVYARFYPHFTGEKFTKEKIYSLLKPGEKFNESLLRNYNSDMLTLAEKFIAVQHNEGSVMHEYIPMLNELNSRKLTSLFDPVYDKALAGFKKNTNKINYLAAKYNLSRELENYNSITKNFSEKALYEHEADTINYFLCVLLDNYAYGVNQFDIKGKKYSYKYLNEFIKFAEKAIESADNISRVYFYRLMLNYSGSEKYYYLLKLIAENIEEPENDFDTYICLINYIKKQKDTSRIDTVKELYELRKTVIERYIMKGDNYLSANIFLSQVRSGLKLGEIENVLTFITSCKDLLPEAEKNNVYHYSMALFYFTSGSLKDALANLNLVTGNNFEPLEVRNLFVRIYWMLDDMDNVESSIAAYKQYLSKNRKIGKDDILKHTKFCSIMEKLFRAKYDGKQLSQNSLAELDENKCYNYKWLKDEAGKIFI